MKRILLIVVIVFALSSCDLLINDCYVPEVEYVDTTVYSTVTCVDLFVYNKMAYTSKRITVPSTIYNPNNYDIVISVDDCELIILSHTSIIITED